MRVLSSFYWVIKFILFGTMSSRRDRIHGEYDDDLYWSFLKMCYKSRSGYPHEVEKPYMKMYPTSPSGSDSEGEFKGRNDILHFSDFDNKEVFAISSKKYDVVDIILFFMLLGELMANPFAIGTIVFTLIFILAKIYHLFEFLKEHSAFILNLKYNLEIFKIS